MDEPDLPPIDIPLITNKELMAMIPHRYPLLLIDKLVDVRRAFSAVGIKNVTANENFFQGHFPGHPVMPGVLIVEAMAQTAAVLVIESMQPQEKPPLVYFMSIDNAKFRRPVVPGDQLRLQLTKDRHRGGVWRFHGVASVDNVTVAEASITAMIMEDKKPAG